MDTGEMKPATVFRLSKTYYTNGMKVESTRIYCPDTHTILESIVMSSAPKIPEHHLEDYHNA